MTFPRRSGLFFGDIFQFLEDLVRFCHISCFDMFEEVFLKAGDFGAHFLVLDRVDRLLRAGQVELVLVPVGDELVAQSLVHLIECSGDSGVGEIVAHGVEILEFWEVGEGSWEGTGE